jgi:hypothetical protein
MASVAAPAASAPFTHRLGLRTSGRLWNDITSSTSRMGAPLPSGPRLNITRELLP